MTAWQPSAAHDALLRASVLQGHAFHAALRQWLERVDIDTVDGPSQRMFPVLFDNATRHGVRGPVVDTLKRHQLVAWVRNQRVLHVTRSALEGLDRAGIAWLLLKGSGIVPLCYRTWAGRPFNDIDVLVRPIDTDRAQAVLEAAGFRSLYATDRQTRDVLKTAHSCAFRSADGVEIDLHSHALMACCDDRFDDVMWSASRRIALPHGAGRTLCETDHVLAAMVHARWTELHNQVPALHWAVDAVHLHATGRVDYERLADLTIAWKLTQAVLPRLQYLVDHLGVDVPFAIRSRMASSRLSRVERFEAATDRITTRQYRRAANLVGQYLRRPDLDLPTYLRHAWGLDSTWQIGPTLARKLGKNARRALRRRGDARRR